MAGIVAAGTGTGRVIQRVTARPAKADARRLIAGRGVSLNGQKASSADLVIDTAVTMKVGSRRFYQIVFR